MFQGFTNLFTTSHQQKVALRAYSNSLKPARTKSQCNQCCQLPQIKKLMQLKVIAVKYFAVTVQGLLAHPVL